MTLAIFSLLGNIPVTRDWFIVIVKGPKISDLMDFIKWVDSSSIPQLFLVDKLSKILDIVFSLTSSKEKREEAGFLRNVLKEFGVGSFIFDARSGPIFTKYLLNEFVITSIFSFKILFIFILLGNRLHFFFLCSRFFIIDHVFFMSEESF